MNTRLMLLLAIVVMTSNGVVVGDDSLSLNAHNVKIITLNRVVTLRGPVESEAEKTTIGKLARQATGVTQVQNQLEIERK